MRLTRLSAGLTIAVALAVVAAVGSARLAAQQDKALDDATIVAIFDAANTFDIETSQLAKTQGQAKGVRDLGAQFAHDHGVVRQQGRDLAKKLGVTPTPPKDFALATQHAEALKELRGKKGADFDRAYLAHEVAYHQAVIDAINGTLLPAIKNAELKAFVQKVGPAFQGHLEAAKQLKRSLGGAS
jgi:putative membrane protein